MSNPSDLRYTEEHEWVRLEPKASAGGTAAQFEPKASAGGTAAQLDSENPEGGRVTVGITDYAQDALGDVVYVDLPENGTRVEQGQPFGEVESTKSVSDLYAPLTGVIAERNATLEAQPELVNSDPYGQGWMVVIEAEDSAAIDGLLTAEAYEQLVASA